MDLDDEISVPTWFSQTLLFVIGMSALFVAYLQTKKATRRLWVVIGCLGLLLSIDEVASLHELVLQIVHNIFYLNSSPTVGRNAWLLVAPIIVVAAGILLWRTYKLLPKRTVFFFAMGFVTLVFGATVIDALAVLYPRNTFMNQGMLVGLEEGLELFGSVIMLLAIINYIEVNHYERLQRILKR